MVVALKTVNKKQYAEGISAAVQSGSADLVLPLEAIGPALDAIIRGKPIPAASQT